MALASLVDKLLKRIEYDGLEAQVAKKYPPMTRARMAAMVTAFCPGVKALKPLMKRRTGAGRRSAMSGLHPHDLLERVNGLVPDGGGELQAELGLGGRHRVLGRVRQRA